MKKFTEWPFNCMEMLDLHCLVTKSLGYEISCTSVGLPDKDVVFVDVDWQDVEMSNMFSSVPICYCSPFDFPFTTLAEKCLIVNIMGKRNVSIVTGHFTVTAWGTSMKGWG